MRRKGGGEERVPTEAENGNPGCRHGSRGAGCSDLEDRENAREAPGNGGPYVPTTLRPPSLWGSRTPRKPKGGGGEGGDLRGRCPGASASLSGDDALAANRAKPSIDVQPRPGRGGAISRQKEAGNDKGETRTGRCQGPRARSQTSRSPHLSQIRAAAPECGKRGSCRSIKAGPRA